VATAATAATSASTQSQAAQRRPSRPESVRSSLDGRFSDPAVGLALDAQRLVVSYAGNVALQEIGLSLMPYKVPDRVAVACFKCATKFSAFVYRVRAQTEHNRLAVAAIITILVVIVIVTIDIRMFLLLMQHHCRSCGGVFCHRCSSRRIHIPIQDKEFETDVRVCDYCHDHLVQGDWFSLLRAAFILQNEGSEPHTYQQALQVTMARELEVVAHGNLHRTDRSGDQNNRHSSWPSTMSHSTTFTWTRSTRGCSSWWSDSAVPPSSGTAS
jgi:hypothetical protein